MKYLHQRKEQKNDTRTWFHTSAPPGAGHHGVTCDSLDTGAVLETESIERLFIAEPIFHNVLHLQISPFGNFEISFFFFRPSSLLLTQLPVPPTPTMVEAYPAAAMSP